MKQPLVIAIVGVGAYLLWKKSQGTVSGIGSPYSDLSGLGKFSVRRAVSNVTQATKAPLQMAATPIRVAMSPVTASVKMANVAVKGGNVKQVFAAGAHTMRAESMTPLTVPMKALQPLMTRDMQNHMNSLGAKPGIRVALGRPKPGSNAPTAIVSSASQGPTTDAGANWSPVDGRSGWEMTTGSDGSYVFRNTGSNSAFYCTASDMSQIGSPQGAIDMFLGVPLQQTPGIMPGSNSGVYNTNAAPDTSSQPGAADSTFVPSSSGQSFSAGQDTASDPAADPSQAMQQYQAADPVAPAAGSKVSPLVVVGTLIAVPLAFMMTGKG